MENIPSIREKARVLLPVDRLGRRPSTGWRPGRDRRRFLLNLICFAACIEGLFFYGAFAYVYWFRSRGLLHGLATGTNWVFRDESMHMDFAFDVVDTVREEEPDLFDDELAAAGHRHAGGGRRGGAAVRRATCAATACRA